MRTSLTGAMDPVFPFSKRGLLRRMRPMGDMICPSKTTRAIRIYRVLPSQRIKWAPSFFPYLQRPSFPPMFIPHVRHAKCRWPGCRIAEAAPKGGLAWRYHSHVFYKKNALAPAMDAAGPYDNRSITMSPMPIPNRTVVMEMQGISRITMSPRKKCNAPFRIKTEISYDYIPAKKGM